MAYMQHRTLLNKLGAYSDDIIDYFDPAMELLTDDYRYEVVIAYLFSRIETAHREILIFGAVKHHHVNSSSARDAIDKIDLTRSDFRNFFKHVYGYHIPTETIQKIQLAEKTRDYILHGKKTKTGEMSEAILKAIDYLNDLNELIYDKSGVWVAGDRTGMFGRKESHNKATSKWILMGMGFLAQPKSIKKARGQNE